VSGSLDIAIAVYRLAAAGGLERHALRLAETLIDRGHRVTLYSTAAGQVPTGATVQTLRRRALTNHGRLWAFAEDLASAARGRHDVVVGFQKMPGLDVLFCCDWCYLDRRHIFPAKLLPRYRTMAALEAGCFRREAKTRLLMLAEPQAAAYLAAYPNCGPRMSVLPPTLDRRRLSQKPTLRQRQEWRAELGIAEDRQAWLWIGLQPKVKGLDRAVRALAKAPDATLLVCGPDPQRRQVRAVLGLARRLKCVDRVRVSGMVDDAMLQKHFLAADLLIHPARLDVTGTVIVEALGAGLPVIVTDNCGYAVHVAASGAGAVMPHNANPAAIAAAATVAPETLKAWSEAARLYAREAELTGGIAAAADAIEELATGGGTEARS